MNESHILKYRQKVVTVAEDILQDRVGVVEGVRALVDLSHRIDVGDHDPDFLPFIGIDSETDHFPLGQARVHWNVDALKVKDAERMATEANYSEWAKDACAKLIKRFANPEEDIQ